LARIANGWILLRDDDDQIVIACRGFDRADRSFAPDFKWPDVAGQLHLGAERNDGVLTGGLGVLGHRGSLQSTTLQLLCSRLRSFCTSEISSFLVSSSRSLGTSICTVT